MWKNGNIVELLLGIIILIFALWKTSWSGWIIAIAAILLIIHSMNFSKKEEAAVEKKKRR